MPLDRTHAVGIVQGLVCTQDLALKGFTSDPYRASGHPIGLVGYGRCCQTRDRFGVVKKVGPTHECPQLQPNLRLGQRQRVLRCLRNIGPSRHPIDRRLPLPLDRTHAVGIVQGPSCCTQDLALKGFTSDLYFASGGPIRLLEARIEVTIHQIANSQKIGRIVFSCGIASDNDLAIGLCGDRVGDIGGVASPVSGRGHDHSVDAEVLVGLAVALEPGEGNENVTAHSGLTGHDDAPLGVNRDGVRPIVSGAQRGDDDAVIAKARIEGAVGEQAQDEEVRAAVKSGGRTSRNNDPPLGVNGHSLGAVEIANRDAESAVVTKLAIETAVCGVAGDQHL